MLATAREGSILLALCLLLSPAPASSQQLAPGQRIRVTAPPLQLSRQVGELLSLDRDSLVLGARGQRWAVAPHLVSRLDVSRGKRGHALIGLAVGAVVSVGAGAILFSPNSTGCTGSGNYAEYCLYYRAPRVTGARRTQASRRTSGASV